MLLHKSTPITQPHPPSSPLDLERFRREALRDPLSNAQRFPLAFVHSNPTPITPFSEAIFFEPMVRETMYAKVPT